MVEPGFTPAGAAGLLASGDQGEHVIAGTQQAGEDHGGRVDLVAPGGLGDVGGHLVEHVVIDVGGRAPAPELGGFLLAALAASPSLAVGQHLRWQAAREHGGSDLLGLAAYRADLPV
ncbi:MAG: hypothetical protein ACRDRP_01270 [Pseudonocardiaceae bacterium]